MPKGHSKNLKKIPCSICANTFTQAHHSHKYCSTKCKRVAARKSGCESTDRQYELISGNWERYFARLCTKSFRRDSLTKHDCITILKKQNYRCALTGMELTCILKKGFVCKTNASIDRIDPKGPYVINNIQLVCAAINKLRIDMSVEEFIIWCRRVSNHALC